MLLVLTWAKHGPTASVGWDQGGCFLGLPAIHLQHQKSSMPWYMSLCAFFTPKHIWNGGKQVSGFQMGM